jgi:CRP/FNR family cyclic AMP-dependent transcriptional regulator
MSSVRFIRVNRDEKIDALRQNACFGSLDADVLDVLVDISDERRVRKNERVIVEGELGNRMFVIVKGTMRVVRRSPAGAVVELTRRGPGDMFGELALFDALPRAASVEAASNAVLLAFERPAFVGILQRDATAVEGLLAFLGRMVRENVELNVDLVFLDVKRRVARRILHLLSERGSLTHANRVTQVDLAHMTGSARQTVSTAMTTLESDGFIRMDSLGIHVEDEAALRALVKSTD